MAIQISHSLHASVTYEVVLEVFFLLGKMWNFFYQNQVYKAALNGRLLPFRKFVQKNGHNSNPPLECNVPAKIAFFKRNIKRLLKKGEAEKAIIQPSILHALYSFLRFDILVRNSSNLLSPHVMSLCPFSLYIELLFPSEREMGVHLEEIARQLKAPIEKIKYSFSLSLPCCELYMFLLISFHPVPCQGCNWDSWEGRFSVLLHWWLSLQSRGRLLAFCFLTLILGSTG